MFERILERISRVAEFIAAMLLAAIFIIFLLQIFTRYAPKIAWLMPIQTIHDWMMALEPIGWTVNLISLLWVWLIFFGCALFVRESDHVAFDVFFQALSRSWQRYLAMAMAIMVTAMLYSFGPTWDAIFGSRLMELKKIQTLRVPVTGDKIPIKWLFASYIMLMIVITLRYIWRGFMLARNAIAPDDAIDAPAVGEGSGGRIMSLELILGLLALFGTAAIGTPIAYSIIVGVIVYLGVAGQDIAIAGETMVQRLFDGFLLLAVPLFIVSANIMNAGSISDRLLHFCVALVGRFRGGLGHVNVVASLIFSGMSGSAVADAAGIGKIIIDMMVKSGRYTRGYAAAITAATATIGPIIPPSIPMVLYALVSNASIGSLFLAGIVPGLAMGIVLMGMNAWISRRRDFDKEEVVPIRELPRVTAKATPALLMPVILLTGIYSGVTTPTEAAAVAALYALIVAAGLYRALKLKTLYEVFVESARSAASVGLVIGASMILTYVVIQENIPQTISTLLAGLRSAR